VVDLVEIFGLEFEVDFSLAEGQQVFINFIPLLLIQYLRAQTNLRLKEDHLDFVQLRKIQLRE
jgi:hypothetical protein